MNTENKQFLLAFLLIVAGVILRLLGVIPNFSPVTAIALFVGD